MKAVFLDYDTFSAGGLDLSGLQATVGQLALCEADESKTAERIGDADVVLLNYAPLSGKLLHGAARLKLIAVVGTGTNNIDIAAARELGIAVCNVRAYCTASVVQHTWALILSITHHVSEYSHMVRSGSWNRNDALTVLAHPIRELDGRIFGVVGWGDLGRGAARIAESFDMRVIVANRRGASPAPDRVPFDALLAESDIVSLHCPLDASTRGLIGARELGLMKSDALLINTARGGLVDSEALALALKAGRLGGAGIDVLPEEPPLDTEPLLDPTIPNLILTPHVAWAAREASQRCLDETAANIREFFGGRRRSRVD
jgi:glycerate dehydrogenase